MKELDTVRLTVDLLDLGLNKGAIGVILLEFVPPGDVFQVEFVDENGRTLTETSIEQSLLELVAEH